MKTLDEFIAEQLETDLEFRKEWERSRPQFEFQRALILAHQMAGLPQQELAQRVGTTQSAISRLEAGDSSPRVEMVFKLARALHVSFEFTPDQMVFTHPPDLDAALN